MGWYQISALRNESKKWQTVKACNLYHTDPTLYRCAAEIRSKTRGKDYTFNAVKDVLQEIRTIVNYLDSLAVGVCQGIYVKSIIEDNLGSITTVAVDKFLTEEFKEELAIPDLHNLQALRNEFANPRMSTKFKA